MFWQKGLIFTSLFLLLASWSWSRTSLSAQELDQEVGAEESESSQEFEESKGDSNVPKQKAPKTPAHDTEGMDAIERNKYEPRISNKWFRGSYLIYDCSRGNFICVNYQGFVRCGEEREEDKKKSRSGLRCAPFKKFSTQELCFKEQYRQIENQKPKIFCMNPKYY